MIETRFLKLDNVEIRAAQDNQPTTARGYAAVFNSNSVDLGGFVERIAPGAFARSLSEAANGETNINALWAHDDASPLGSTRGGKLVLSEDDKGLAFELNVARFNPAQLSALEDGDLQMSFGFRVREDKWLRLEDDVDEYERTLIDVDLREISFVLNPAYPATDAALRSLDGFKSELRAAEKVDTLEQLKRVMFLQARIRTR